MTATRVLVTGLGTTSPVGGDVTSTWSALLSGQSGVDTLKHDWADELGTQIAGEVAVDPADVLDRVKARRLDRSGQLAMVAALEAWADAGLAGDEAPELDPERVAVAMASGIGGVQTLLSNYDALQGEGPPPGLPAGDPDAHAQRPRRRHRPRRRRQGRRAHAGLGVRVGQRVDRPRHRPDPARPRRRRRRRWHRGGDPRRCRMAAFGQMMALSKRNDEPERASRPWDKGRDGFVHGRGRRRASCSSPRQHAPARGAKVYAEAAGAGITADSHDIAQPRPRGARRHPGDEDRALREAGLAPRDIVHINAHATSTPQGDLAEALAIRQALGDGAADGPWSTSTKSMTGHLLGAAGALESLATVLALHHRVVPPTINLEDPEDIGLDVATDAPGPARRARWPR